jgi:hypothetical protein
MGFFAKNLLIVIASIVLGIFTNIGLSFFSNQVVAPTCQQFRLDSCTVGLSYQVLIYTFVGIFLLWFILLRISLNFWLK